LIEPERVTERNAAPARDGDYVLYWMQQSQRAASNPALEFAIAEANRLGLPVLVAFGLTDAYPEANARHYAFMLEGLADVASALRQRGIAFVIRRGAPDDVAIRLSQKAAMVVCDRGYLRVQKAWRERVAREVTCRVVQIEGDVVVPVDLVATKPVIGARSLRPRILRTRDHFLVALRATAVRVPADRLDIHGDDVELGQLKVDRSISPVTTFRGGQTEGRRLLKKFVGEPIEQYDDTRMQPGVACVSWMSPYLHFGHMSPVEIAVAARGAETYLEELIVRRELAMNFVNTTPEYDSYAAIPEWARQTLANHKRDQRPNVYGYDQLAGGETHDPYWNAAMREMMVTGYMHNYMRMYWGKKVLEWSEDPEEGYETLLKLNNTYFLDGRDANSYANVGWVFGLHDRPWPERPIYGSVRSMTAGGLERKTDIAEYVRRVATL
jgi:deoxyribodipyrimidine photo-lyase